MRRVERQSRECVQCGSQFFATAAQLSRGRRFCSYACTRLALQTHERLPSKTCASCGKSFSTANHHAEVRFCSSACYWASRRKAPGDRGVERVCEACGKAFRL